MKKLSIIFLVIFFFAILAGINSAFGSNEVEAEAVDRPADESGQWAQQYTGPETDFASAIVQTEDGGFVMAGHTDSFGSGNLDLWVVKLTPEGGIWWEKTYGDDNLEYASDITEAENGDLLVAGNMYTYGGQGVDSGYWILRLSGTGEIIWQKLFTEAFSDENDILETSDQGIVIAGGWNEGTSLMKLDFDGNILWQKLYDNQVVLFDGTYFSIDERLDGGLIASFPNVQGEQWVSKLDSQGNIEWQKIMSGSYHRVTVNALGNDGFYVSGNTQTNAIVLKLAPNGDILWQKSLFLDSTYALWSADTTNDGGIILAGRVDGNYWLIRLDAEGNLLWDKIYERGTVEDVEQTSNGEYIVVGNQYPDNPAPYYPWALTDENSITRPEAFPTLDGSFDILAFKVDTNGEINECSEIQPGNAIITDTNVTLMDAFVTPIAITPNPTDSVITPQTSNATEELVCYFFLTPTPTPFSTLIHTATPSPTSTSTNTSTPSLGNTATATLMLTSTITSTPTPSMTPPFTPTASPIYHLYLPLLPSP